MSGWFRAPSDGWAIARDHIPTPWPRECVITDLRWHLDRVEQGVAPFPGRRKLAAAWGWTDWATRAVLRDEAAWKPNHPSTTPVASHFPPAANPPRVGRTPETERNPPASLPPPPQSPPASLHTRVGTDTDNRHQTQTSLPSVETQDPPAEPDGPAHVLTDLDRAWSVYRRCQRDAMRCTRAKRPAKGWGIQARLDEHGLDAVALVIEWAHHSDHDRADYLRRNGHVGRGKDGPRPGTTGETLFRRSKFPEYLRFAMDERDARAAGARAPPRRRSARPTIADTLREITHATVP